MPYVITAGSKYRKNHSLECWPLPRGGFPPDQCGCEFMDSFTRITVATLDEAREAATDAVGEHAPAPADGQPDEWDAALATIDATGGTIGPLPDGTVVEVRPTN